MDTGCPNLSYKAAGRKLGGHLPVALFPLTVAHLSRRVIPGVARWRLSHPATPGFRCQPCAKTRLCLAQPDVERIAVERAQDVHTVSLGRIEQLVGDQAAQSRECAIDSDAQVGMLRSPRHDLLRVLLFLVGRGLAEQPLNR